MNYAGVFLYEESVYDSDRMIYKDCTLLVDIGKYKKGTYGLLIDGSRYGIYFEIFESEKSFDEDGDSESFKLDVNVVCDDSDSES